MPNGKKDEKNYPSAQKEEFLAILKLIQTLELRYLLDPQRDVEKIELDLSMGIEERHPSSLEKINTATCYGEGKETLALSLGATSCTLRAEKNEIRKVLHQAPDFSKEWKVVLLRSSLCKEKIWRNHEIFSVTDTVDKLIDYLNEENISCFIESLKVANHRYKESNGLEYVQEDDLHYQIVSSLKSKIHGLQTETQTFKAKHEQLSKVLHQEKENKRKIINESEVFVLKSWELEKKTDKQSEKIKCLLTQLEEAQREEQAIRSRFSSSETKKRDLEGKNSALEIQLRQLEEQNNNLRRERRQLQEQNDNLKLEHLQYDEITLAYNKSLKNKNILSADVIRWIAYLKENPHETMEKKAQEYLAAGAITEEEKEALENKEHYKCAIELVLPEIPVTLNGTNQIYNLDSLTKSKKYINESNESYYYENPTTKKEFFLADISPSRSTIELFNKELNLLKKMKEMSENHEKQLTQLTDESENHEKQLTQLTDENKKLIEELHLLHNENANLKNLLEQKEIAKQEEKKEPKKKTNIFKFSLSR